jgi:DNA-binding MurR/RpiR family transcriptional regulator
VVSDIQQRVRALAPSLAPAERRVAQAILTDPAGVVERTITEIAAYCTTSETTVVRFCRSAGFKGYPELRLALAGELGRERARRGDDVALAADITRDDPVEVMVGKLAYAERRAIEDTVDRLDLAALEKAVAAVGAARRVQLYGLGASGLAAQDLQEKLLRIGLMAYQVPDPDLSVGVAALLGPEDVAIAVSHSGETASAAAFVRTAAGRGATTVAVTGTAGSAVAAAASLVLVTAARESVLRSGAMASRIAQLAVLDCLFVGVLQRHPDRAGSALVETHGAVHRPDVNR